MSWRPGEAEALREGFALGLSNGNCVKQVVKPNVLKSRVITGCSMAVINRKMKSGP